MVFMTGVVYDEGSKWGDGKLYDPKTGKTYSCNLTLLEKNKIEVRGYMGISLLGKSIYWYRTEKK